jgi:thiol-disulfide isomerase/thioredoxin
MPLLALPVARVAAVGLMAAIALTAVPRDANAATVGDPAPALALPDARDVPVKLADLRGKVVYVDFWASWCGPCKRSFPWMNELAKRYGGDGFTVLAVNVDKKRGDAQRFLAQVPASVTVVYDPAGTTPAAWEVKGMPSSFIVDRAGKVALAMQGFHDDEKGAVEQRIRELLAAR